MSISRNSAVATAALMITGMAACASPDQSRIVRAGINTPGPTITTDLTGKVYALGVHADAGQRTVTFDKIDWFFGKAATAACKADKVKIPPAAWCNDFYYRNRNPLKRTVSVADSAAISLVDYNSSASPVPRKSATLEAVDRRFKDSETILILTIHKGVIVELREQFTP